jgi:hypothetical protein
MCSFRDVNSCLTVEREGLPVVGICNFPEAGIRARARVWMQLSSDAFTYMVSTGGFVGSYTLS